MCAFLKRIHIFWMARPIHDSEVNSPLPRLEQPQLYVSIIIVDNYEFLESIDDQNKNKKNIFGTSCNKIILRPAQVWSGEHLLPRRRPACRAP